MPPTAPLSRALRAAGLVAAAVVGIPWAAAGQTGCQFVSPTRSLQSFTIPGQGQIAYVGGPFVRCADGVRIRADSAVAYVAQNMTYLMGNVVFRDGAKELTADEARYFSRQGRLQATGNTVLRDTVQGSVIRHGDMILLRATDTREKEQITVTPGFDQVRPTARLIMTTVRDTTTPPPPPAERLASMAPDSGGVAQPDSLAGGLVADTTGVVPADTTGAAEADPTAQVPPDTARATPDSTALALEGPPDMEARGADAPAGPRDSTDVVVDTLPRAPLDTVYTPYDVTGDRIFLEGDSYFLATGSVVIERDSLLAYADSAEYDQVAERMLLRGSARVDGGSYDLVGRTINIALPDGDMGSVRAVQDAVLVGDDLRLEAPMIQLYLNDGAMERLVAVPLPGDPLSPPMTARDSADLARPVATAQGFRLVADSVEVLAPGEILDRIFAAGRARGESSARDSLNVESLPEVARKDWLEGDTIIARFARVEPDPLMPPDTTADEYRLEELWAVGSARSLYRMLPSDSLTRPGVDAPAVHYVTGSQIVIVMLDGEVDRMEVEGPTRGWHLEPVRREGRDSLVAPDSARVVPDTGAAPPDTASARRPGSGGRGPDGGGGGERGGGQGVAVPAEAPGQRRRGRRRRW